ncbi:hypothetical protein D5086_032313 [Populus alba]|uniref:Uncharacterized protein n=1 Tax=Populus alba TaxID=43335 RepID=A0ACC4ALV7_POPAL
MEPLMAKSSVENGGNASFCEDNCLLVLELGVGTSGPEAVEGNLGPNKIRLVRIEARAFNIHTAVGGNDWVAKECGHFLKGVVLDVKNSEDQVSVKASTGEIHLICNRVHVPAKGFTIIHTESVTKGTVYLAMEQHTAIHKSVVPHSASYSVTDSIAEKANCHVETITCSSSKAVSSPITETHVSAILSSLPSRTSNGVNARNVPPDSGENTQVSSFIEFVLSVPCSTTNLRARGTMAPSKYTVLLASTTVIF